MRFQSLGSGSNGNCLLVDFASTTFLIDCGIPKYRVLQGLNEFRLWKADLRFVFVTHAHHDHVAGLPVLYSEIPQLKVVATKDTIDHLASFQDKDPRFRHLATQAITIQEFDALYFDNLEVHAYPSFHDIEGAIGFHFRDLRSDFEFSYTTDTSGIIREFEDKMRATNFLYLESNYEPELLAKSDRPISLKRRIEKTHLSNYEALRILKEVHNKYLQLVAFGHLSGECNTPGIVSNNLAEYLVDTQVSWVVNERDCMGTHIKFNREGEINFTGGINSLTFQKNPIKTMDQFFG